MLQASVSSTLRKLKDENYDHLASYLTKTWLLQPHQKSSKKAQMWQEQIAVNLPVLYLASICLHRFVKEKKIKNLLFATRDCSHWYKIYAAMYPDDNVQYFHCSRNMFNTARLHDRPEYEKYINTITNDDIKHTVYIDVHGTGRRMYQYFSARKQKQVPKCFILSSSHSIPEHLFLDIQNMIKKGDCKFMTYGASGSPIEMLNYDLIGTCNDYTKEGPARASLEYDEKYVKIYHECVNQFIEIIKHKQIDNHGDKCLYRMVNVLLEPILDDLPIISIWINHERKHDRKQIS